MSWDGSIEFLVVGAEGVTVAVFVGAAQAVTAAGAAPVGVVEGLTVSDDLTEAAEIAVAPALPVDGDFAARR